MTGRISCPVCGPKLSLFFMIISIWGIVFLGILGFFFYLQSMTLFEDLELPVKDRPLKSGEIIPVYTEKATQCWIASGLYGVTLVAVFWQNKWNTESVF